LAEKLIGHFLGTYVHIIYICRSNPTFWPLIMQWSRDTISVCCYCAHDAEMKSSWLNVYPSLDVLKAVSTNWKIHPDTDVSPVWTFAFLFVQSIAYSSS
jgi:hypothetical protein